jgi:hypothetical protein
MVMFMDDVRYFQSFTIFTTNSYRHRTLHLECTEKTFLPGVRVGEGKRGAHDGIYPLISVKHVKQKKELVLCDSIGKYLDGIRVLEERD